MSCWIFPDDPSEDDFFIIAILAIIAGSDDFNEIARYAKLKKDWLTGYALV